MGGSQYIFRPLLAEKDDHMHRNSWHRALSPEIVEPEIVPGVNLVIHSSLRDYGSEANGQRFRDP